MVIPKICFRNLVVFQDESQMSHLKYFKAKCRTEYFYPFPDLTYVQVDSQETGLMVMLIIIRIPPLNRASFVCFHETLTQVYLMTYSEVLSIWQMLSKHGGGSNDSWRCVAPSLRKALGRSGSIATGENCNTSSFARQTSKEFNFPKSHLFRYYW